MRLSRWVLPWPVGQGSAELPKFNVGCRIVGVNWTLPAGSTIDGNIAMVQVIGQGNDVVYETGITGQLAAAGAVRESYAFSVNRASELTFDAINQTAKAYCALSPDVWLMPGEILRATNVSGQAASALVVTLMAPF